MLHHQGFAAFAHVISDLVREVRALQAERYPGEPLLLTFDRGGYSAELFAELDRLAVVFVTWKKHARRLPEAEFAGTATLTFGEGKAARTLQYVQATGPVPHYHEQVYALVLREPKTGSQLTLISNADRMAPGRYTPADLAEALLRRWALGASGNPSWPRFLKRKRNRPILERRQALETEHARVTAQLAGTPAQLPYRRLHPEAVQGLRLDRLEVVTTLRAVAFHVRAQLSERVAACFADARERGKFLDVPMSGDRMLSSVDCSLVLNINYMRLDPGTAGSA